MEPLVILLDERPCGELVTEECGLYQRYRAVCHVGIDTEPMRLFAIGERGELRLGVMQPEDGRFVLHRQVTAKEACAAGKLLRGELRPLAHSDNDWHPAKEPEKLFQRPALQKRMRGRVGVMVSRRGGHCFLAIPFDVGGSFPLPDMFCLARVRRYGQRQYVVFCFDDQENPKIF